MGLFRTEQPLLNRQQNFASLNIAMRNAAAQILTFQPVHDQAGLLRSV